MANITPILATQETEQNTTSQSMVDANCETGVLANGVDYLVIHTANYGGSDTSAVPMAQILFGSTVIGYGAGEGRGLGTHVDSGSLNGFKKVTGNGSDTLKFQFGTATSGDTAYIGAMKIIAIPLTELTENTDYWFSGTNSDTLEVTDASTSWETLRSQAFTLPSTGDYLVLMSMEGLPDSSATSEGARYRASVDGTYICQTEDSTYGWQEEAEDTADCNAQAWCTMESVSSGSRTFAIECASASSGADFRRSNIWVFRKAAFEQIVQNKFSSGTSTSSSTYVDWSASDQAINPTEQSYIVVLGYAVGQSSSYYTSIFELYNVTDTSEHCIDGGEYVNDYGTGSADRVAMFLAHSAQYNTGSDTWRFRIRANGGTAYFGYDLALSGSIQSNLILWQLSTAGAAPTPDHEAMQLGCNV